MTLQAVANGNSMWRPLSVVHYSRNLPSYLLLTFTVLLPLILFAVVVLEDRADVLQQAQRQVTDTTDIFEVHARNVFETHELIARAINARLGSMTWDEIQLSAAAHNYLKALVADYPQTKGIWLVDAHGKLRASSRLFPVPDVNVSDREFFATVRDQNLTSLVSEIVRGRLDEAPYFNFVHRRSSADNSFNGLIVVRVSADYFTEFWRKSVPDPNMVATLLKGDLTLLARVPAVPNTRVLANNARQGPAEAAAQRSFRAVSSLDGVDRLIAFRQIGPYDVYLAHGISVTAALAPWRRHLQIYGAFFGLSTIALLGASLLAVKRMRQWRLAAAEVVAEGQRRRIVEEQLHQAEKMEAIGQLTGQFAHDFGNILAAVLLNLEPARDEARNEHLGEAIGSAIIAAEEGQKAVRSMLAFARREPPLTESIDLAVTLGQIEILAGQALGSRSRISIAIPRGTWPVRADAIQLELAILNLTVNARDAMPNGGTLRISASNVHAEEALIGLDGDFVALSIVDTGGGIAPDIVSKVFEPFFTTKEKGKGTGLGLSQVYSFARACGGSVTLESQPGLGTKVTIYLPSAVEPSETEEEAAAPPPEPTADMPEAESADDQPGNVILVVEDEEPIRRAVARVLRRTGYQVIEAPNGDEAIEILKSHPEIELIFTDVRMPGKRDGIAMAAEAKLLRPELKIVFATGHPGDALRNFTGATILPKPYHSRQILRAVDLELVA